MFFVGEEIGCVGSRKASMRFFRDCRFVIQCDRKGNSDIVTSINGTSLCSDAFIEAIKPEDHGYSECHGLLTDVLTLKQRGLSVSCINLSCGYYNPHTDKEVTILADLMKCYEFVRHIIRTHTEVSEHKYMRWRTRDDFPISIFGYDDSRYLNRRNRTGLDWEEYEF